MSRIALIDTIITRADVILVHDAHLNHALHRQEDGCLSQRWMMGEQRNSEFALCWMPELEGKKHSINAGARLGDS